MKQKISKMNKLITIFITILLLNTANVFALAPEIETKTYVFRYYKEAKFKKNEITKPFYFIRHGQTDLNKYGIAPENLDVPLNKEGVLQAKKAAELLRGKNIQIIISSPLARTKQTAEIIGKTLKLPIIYHDGLKEANWGIIAGDDVKKPSKNKKIWLKGGEVQGVESLYQFQTKIHDTIKEIVNKYDNVLIVGHGTYFGNLIILLNGEAVKVSNAVPFYLTPSEDAGKELYQICSLSCCAQTC